MPTPNDDFTAGQVLTAGECNNFPRGAMAYSANFTSYTLTLTETITTGMSVTFDAVAGRAYKLTYFEPAANTPAVISGRTTLGIRLTNATGTLVQRGYLETPVAVKIQGTVGLLDLYFPAASGSVTIVGTSFASSLTGAPTIDRTLLIPGFLLVEDIGIA